MLEEMAAQVGVITPFRVLKQYDRVYIVTSQVQRLKSGDSARDAAQFGVANE
jgi:hypothetical protein